MGVFILVFIIITSGFFISIVDSFELKKGQLKVTIEHPFLKNGEWVPAQDLKKGDTITTKNGREAVITSIRKVKEKTTVYNLEDEKYHNYIVDGNGDGTGGVVVHNSNDVFGPQSLGAAQSLPFIDEATTQAELDDYADFLWKQYADAFESARSAGTPISEISEQDKFLRILADRKSALIRNAGTEAGNDYLILNDMDACNNIQRGVALFDSDFASNAAEVLFPGEDVIVKELGWLSSDMDRRPYHRVVETFVELMNKGKERWGEKFRVVFMVRKKHFNDYWKLTDSKNTGAIEQINEVMGIDIETDPLTTALVDDTVISARGEAYTGRLHIWGKKGQAMIEALKRRARLFRKRFERNQ